MPRVCKPKPEGAGKRPTPVKEADRNRSVAKYWVTGDGLVVVSQWMRNGATIQMIADSIGVNLTTIYDWRKKYPEFADALESSREYADMLVENMLFKKAMGYDYVETIKEGYIDKNGKQQVKIKEVTKHVAPESTAIIFWLKNRRPKNWYDRKEVKIIEDTTADENQASVFAALMDGDEE